MKLHELPARAEEGFHVVVESPRGSPLKLVYDPESGAVFGGRALPLGLAYPYDWGFVPGTRAPDGDPLDALVYWDVPSFPGVVLRCRLLGALQLEQDEDGGERVRNDRVIAVPLGHVRGDDVRSVGELSPRVRDELAHFFTSAVYFNAKNPKVLGWSDPAAAERLVEEHRAKR
ncbi:MAG: inorganic diphosphatase [Myxococcales bacterium]